MFGYGARLHSLSAGHPGQRKEMVSKVAPMTKWEYATVPLLSHATKQILDNWGEDGWDLVSVIPGPLSMATRATSNWSPT